MTSSPRACASARTESRHWSTNGAPTFDAITTEILLVIPCAPCQRRDDINHEYRRHASREKRDHKCGDHRSTQRHHPGAAVPAGRGGCAMAPVLSSAVRLLRGEGRLRITVRLRGNAMTELFQRVAKHAKLNWQNLALPDVPSPPFLILFINSICNMKCEHCFYWQQLNQRDDLTFEEIVALSEELGADREPQSLRRRAVPAQGVRRDLPAVHPAERRQGDLRPDQRLVHGQDDPA